MYPFACLVSNALLCAFAVAQFPPTPEDVTTIQSQFDDGITISYKEVWVVNLLLLLLTYVCD